MKAELLLSLNIIIPLLSSLFRHKFIVIFLSLILLINNFVIYYFNIKGDLILGEILGNYKLSLKINSYSVLFSIMVSALTFITNIYSYGYLKGIQESRLKHDLNPKIHFFFMPLAILAAINTAYSANLITLFIFYELLTLTTYPLVIQSFSENAKKAGRLYFFTLFGSSSFFLLLAMIYLDSLNLLNLFIDSPSLLSSLSSKEILGLLICFVFGFSKTAIFPLYKWLPKAMVAPIPVSGILHAVAVVKTGIFALMKVFLYVFGLNLLESIKLFEPYTINWLVYLACFTAIFASLKATKQESLKKLLAYSTIAQLSYMIISLCFVTEKNFDTAFNLLLGHSIAKLILFFVAGNIYLTTHKLYISEMGSIIKIMPISVTIFIIAALSLIGFPYTPGYLISSKLIDIIYCQNFIGSVAVTTLLLCKILSCYYFGKTIFVMLSPSNNRIEIFYRDKKLEIFVLFSFIILSLILFSYLQLISK